jgi:ParB/RepB/Spo0J family partition protein
MRALRQPINNNTTRQEIKEILLENVITDFENVRTQYDNQSIVELADSIERHGLIQPITVLRIDDRYKIIAGHRRFKAFQYLLSQDKPTYSQIPAIVKNSTQDLEEVQLIENIQRENLSPADTEKAVLSIIEKHGLTQEQAGQRIGKSKKWINAILTADTIRDELKKSSQLDKMKSGQPDKEKSSQLDFDKVSSHTLSPLAGIKDKEQRQDAFREVIKRGGTQKHAKDVAKEYQGKAKPDTVKQSIPAGRPADQTFMLSAGAALNDALLFIKRRQGHFDKSELKDISKQLTNITRELLFTLKDKDKSALIAAIKSELDNAK